MDEREPPQLEAREYAELMRAQLGEHGVEPLVTTAAAIEQRYAPFHAARTARVNEAHAYIATYRDDGSPSPWQPLGTVRDLTIESGGA